MPSMAERQVEQVAAARANESFWQILAETHTDVAAGHKGLIPTAKQTIAKSEAAANEASAKASADRAAMAERGEDTGPISKPPSYEASADRSWLLAR